MLNIFMVAGADAISYAEHAMASLFRNCRQDFVFTVITDRSADKAAYRAVLSRLAPAVTTHVVDEAECDHRAKHFFADQPNIRCFRKGHPCWRKITDPSLFVKPGSKIIVLDPDLYFPNPFVFEKTPPGQLLLMRQRRHCLLPDQVVQQAFRAGMRLAHHTDIGVAQHTTLPWDWIDQAILTLGGATLPRVPHVESILWAAIAMRIGGGYLNDQKWKCWERTTGKRMLMMLGISGPGMLRLERIRALKCFHASSGAKIWLVDGQRLGLLVGGASQLEPSGIRPYVELSPRDYATGERLKAYYHRTLCVAHLRDPFSVRS